MSKRVTLTDYERQILVELLEDAATRPSFTCTTAGIGKHFIQELITKLKGAMQPATPPEMGGDLK